jgi:hypothetical protein
VGYEEKKVSLDAREKQELLDRVASLTTTNDELKTKLVTAL